MFGDILERAAKDGYVSLVQSDYVERVSNRIDGQFPYVSGLVSGESNIYANRIRANRAWSPNNAYGLATFRTSENSQPYANWSTSDFEGTKYFYLDDTDYTKIRLTNTAKNNMSSEQGKGYRFAMFANPWLITTLTIDFVAFDSADTEIGSIALSSPGQTNLFVSFVFPFPGWGLDGIDYIKIGYHSENIYFVQFKILRVR